MRCIQSIQQWRVGRQVSGWFGDCWWLFGGCLFCGLGFVIWGLMLREWEKVASFILSFFFLFLPSSLFFNLFLTLVFSFFSFHSLFSLCFSIQKRSWLDCYETKHYFHFSTRLLWWLPSNYDGRVLRCGAEVVADGRLYTYTSSRATCTHVHDLHMCTHVHDIWCTTIHSCTPRSW